ncbi:MULTISPECIES: EF-hand domain-containing protein [Pseudomonas]|uniref:EF-hand domain-containing protein n=2 Tax=Pseudomonas fragariae (ex Marin et al. 2024) TaxID=3080056 RepID=A0ABT3LFG3_9PSED|nr:MULTISPECIES: EF-hand domain-containing protein [Pseudomonas]MCW6055182.1 EF-hand domain-containing protein [Pseudomonas fragi]MCA5971417.1 EF-hand domain-containing protein [Pseudomonas sp. P135]MCF4983063.1 EF-hand domain-containing protein [Pseudomonas syringae]MCF5030309.1 EF-hand domain-containing protein [Pseudomonas syringae]MCF5204537.1 EF-hand domain-containing protein [Pseudomonas syringae]
MATLTDKQLARVREDFYRYDTNGDKKVTVAEFRLTMEKYLTPEDFDVLLAKINSDGNDEISWEEFLKDYESDLG